jgi:hypothetical protein
MANRDFPMLKQIRKALAPIVDGPVLRWWSLRQARKADAAFLRVLCQERDRAPQPLAGPPQANKIPSGSPLRTILFIGDCMWEQNALFPELHKICGLQFLDLHPALTQKPHARPAETVAKNIEAFIRASTSLEPDAILFYARPQLLSEVAFDLIRRRWKCPLLGMNLDDRVEFFGYGVYSTTAEPYGPWVTKFDVNLTNTRAALDWYRQRGASVRYFPAGFRLDEAYQSPPAEPEYDYPFSFLGTWKSERAVIVERLLQAGVKIALFGKGWPNSQWVESASRVFRRSQINLGIGFASPSARITTAKGRDLECPGVGACYLTTYNGELPFLYEIGKEILCYRDFEELLEMHAYYSKRPDECLRIAQAAHRRCAAEHTWEKRFRQLFRELGFHA